MMVKDMNPSGQRESLYYLCKIGENPSDFHETGNNKFPSSDRNGKVYLTLQGSLPGVIYLCYSCYEDHTSFWAGFLV